MCCGPLWLAKFGLVPYVVARSINYTNRGRNNARTMYGITYNPTEV